jgi:hypothetical protein
MLGTIAAATEIGGTAVSSTIVIKISADECDQHTLDNGKMKDEAFSPDAQKKKKGPKSNVECDSCHKKGHTKL